ncbi:MAG: hypothetical protein IJ403_06505 [Oscillospiraceae bacterium]|nr:hypothetical protein [Oscillospiraceae bacterium]
MLYLSTRNTTDCYTAYRALNEMQAPDGGFYVPFRLHKFTDSELLALRAKTPCDAIAQILNLFFGVQLTGWDVECVVGRSPVKPETVNQRLLFAEFWRNPDGSLKYLIYNLYRRITAKDFSVSKPTGWAYIAIEIALLFGLYAAAESIPPQGLDVAVETGDFADVTAIEYANQMGLPINMMICATNENSSVWDLFTKGDYNTATPVEQPKYLECFLFARLGRDAVLRYLETSEKKRIFRVGEQELETLCDNVFCSVVSENRVESIISGMYRANGYVIDPSTAVAYGGLQDYRANGGLHRDTLLLAKHRPALEKE